MIVSFKDWLQEARRNPELNPKISAYESLKKYKNDPDVYISFTKNLGSDEDKFGPKIGINPSSTYNTPLGVFVYPLEEIWSFYQIDRHRTLKVLPFAAELPNIFVLRAKNVGKTFIDNMYSDYGSDKFDKDVIILEKIWKRDVQKVADKVFVSYDWEDDVKAAKRNVSKYEEFIFAFEENKDDYKNDYDKQIKKYKDKLKFYQSELDSLNKNKLQILQTKTWQELKEEGIDTAKVRNPIMSFWNISRLIAKRLTPNKSSLSSITKWNSILRECGYTGFADKSGRSYIHESEPIQAVFLSRDAFTVLDMVLNKDYNTDKDTVQSIKRMNKNIEHDLELVGPYLKYLVKSGSTNTSDEEIQNSISIKPYQLIEMVEYYDLKDFILNCLRYFKEYVVSEKDKQMFIIWCKTLRSKYSTTHGLSPDDNEWKVINNIITKMV